MTLHHILYSFPSPNFQTTNQIHTKPAAFLPLRHPQVAQPSAFILQLSVPQSLRHSASETGHPGSCGGAENKEQNAFLYHLRYYEKRVESLINFNVTIRLKILEI